MESGGRSMLQRLDFIGAVHARDSQRRFNLSLSVGIQRDVGRRFVSFVVFMLVAAAVVVQVFIAHSFFNTRMRTRSPFAGSLNGAITRHVQPRGPRIGWRTLRRLPGIFGNGRAGRHVWRTALRIRGKAARRVRRTARAGRSRAASPPWWRGKYPHSRGRRARIRPFRVCRGGFLRRRTHRKPSRRARTLELRPAYLVWVLRS